jgi:hypothetical protein
MCEKHHMLKSISTHHPPPTTILIIMLVPCNCLLAGVVAPAAWTVSRHRFQPYASNAANVFKVGTEIALLLTLTLAVLLRCRPARPPRYLCKSSAAHRHGRVGNGIIGGRSGRARRFDLSEEDISETVVGSFMVLATTVRIRVTA